MLTPGFSKSFVGSLHNALSSNVNPRSRGHLAVHRQTLLVEFVKVIPGRPVWHKIGIGDQHTRRIFVGAKHANGFARLYQQGFIIIQGFQGGHDLIKILPRPCSPANTTVNHQFMWIFSDIRV